LETYDFEKPNASRGLKIAAVLGLVFGIVTVLSSGNVLFGSDKARELVGDFIPFVVWFNFCAGFVYITTAAGIWLNKRWAFYWSLLIVATTALAALIFGLLVMQGSAFEMRTVGALALRVGFWSAIAFALYRSVRRPNGSQLAN
jgi:hypothetical protein